MSWTSPACSYPGQRQVIVVPRLTVRVRRLRGSPATRTLTVVYLVCSGIEVFRAEGQSTTSFGQSGALEPGSCQLIAEAHSDRDTSGTSNVTVNLSFFAA